MDIEKAKQKKEECFWCKSQTPKTKKGWIPYYFQNFPQNSLLFCSKKCLSSATVDGKGKCLSVNKIAVKQRRDNKKKNSLKMHELMQKEQLNNADTVQLFLRLSAKQKKVLALIGLAQMSWAAHGNPEKLLNEINNKVALLKSK